jgi:hypothetical protein
MNILEKANEIVNLRKQEKERQYGPFSETKITVEDLYNMQIALKLARESWSHKEDNLLDCVAYIAALNNYLENQKVEPNDITKNEPYEPEFI